MSRVRLVCRLNQRGLYESDQFDIEQSLFAERRDGDEGRKAPEAGRSDRVQHKETGRSEEEITWRARRLMVIGLSVDAFLWWLCFNSRIAYTVTAGTVRRVVRVDIGGNKDTAITPTLIRYEHFFDLVPPPTVEEFLDKTKKWPSQEVTSIT